MADCPPEAPGATFAEPLSADEQCQLLDSLPIGTGVQVAGVVVYVNPAGARLLGGEAAAEFLGRPILDFVHPDDRTSLMEGVRGLTQGGGSTFEQPYVFLDLQGREVPVLVTTTPITFRGEPGTQIAFHASSLVRKEHQELKRLRTAVNSSSEVVFMTDRAGLFTYVNPEFTRIYGYESEELLGRKTPRVLKSSDSRPESHAQFWETILAGDVVRGELVNKTKSGRLLTVDSSTNPVFDEAGEMSGFIAIQRDVTQRKEREQLLRLTRFSLENSLDAVFWITSKGRIHLANAAASTLLGYSREDFVDMSIWDVDTTITADDWQQAWARIQGLGTVLRQRVYRAKDGAAIPVEASGKYIEFDGAEYLFTVMRDTRERDVLTAQLQQALKMEAVGQLAGGIAHDFNNLLAAILCCADFVTNSLGPHDPILDDVEEIRGAAQRAVQLTRQLLAFSRKQMMETTTFDLRDAATDMEKILRRVIGEDVKLIVRKGREPLFVTADVSQVEQVVMNLAVNARDAMPSGGELELSLRADVLDEDFVAHHPGSFAGPVAILAIRDTGVGMDEETCSHVFEPFFTTKPVGQGTGLGLSTVYGIVKQSGGYIGLETEPGVGTTFAMYLPKASADAATQKQRLVGDKALGVRGTVLLVEDDNAVLRVSQRTLRLAGLKVLPASGPGEALLLHEQHAGEIDLLVSDVVMPRLSGIELARRLRARQPALRVLLMTGYIDHKHLEPSGFEVLRKPFTTKSLREKVAAMLSASPPTAD